MIVRSSDYYKMGKKEMTEVSYFSRGGYEILDDVRDPNDHLLQKIGFYEK